MTQAELWNECLGPNRVSHGSVQVFVSENDVYWMESIERPNAVRITSNGKKRIMFNGIPDWVYEGKPRCNWQRNGSLVKYLHTFF